MPDPSWPMPRDWWQARRLELAAAAARSAVRALQALPPSRDTTAALDRAQRSLLAAERRLLPDWLR